MSRSAGKVMPLPRGPYDAKATYNILDLVTYDNKLWMARKSNIFGVLPSKDASEEWMLAVDGTTDVKGLETEVNAKFEEYDNKFTQLGEKDTSIEESITNLGEQITAVNDKFVFDTKPKENSTNLVNSGCVYDLFRHTEYVNGSEGADEFETQGSSASFGREAFISSSCRQKFTLSNSEKVDRNFYGAISIQTGHPYLYSSVTPMSDNTSTGYNQNQSTSLSVNDDDITLSLSKEHESSARNNTMFINFTIDDVYTQDDSSYDLGRSGNKFRNIYAQTGSIQTSDRNEKKDITDLVAIASENFIMGLNPVSYKFINGTSDRTHYGLIAQDVEELLAELGIDSKDFAGLIKAQKMDEDENPVEGEYVYGLRYDEFIAPLISMCQGLKKKNDELNDRIRTLQNAVAALEEKVGDM